MKSFELLESNVLREALESGVINPVMPVFDNIDSEVFRWAIDNHSAERHWQLDPQFAPQTQRYAEHTYPAIVQPEDQSWLVELARVGVPRGSVGYLKSIEQFLQDDEANFYPTASEYWGLPYHEILDMRQVSWYLRLEEFTGFLPPRFAYNAAAVFNPQDFLPGFLNWDLPEFQDIWYPPHCHSRMPNIVIPGGYMLRFFFFVGHTPASIYRWQVLGRLRAVIQSSQCKEANWNTRISGW